ncbi:chromosome partition protein Smc-like [Centruroides vittatus]|uniref:chromosome partition protein Smc-like n=2 Tax=Centruroides vittatus TaxID=120091 RepID=UPI003510CBC9
MEEIIEWKTSLVLNKTQITIPEHILETIRKGLDFNGPNTWEVLDIIPNLDRMCNELEDTESRILKTTLNKNYYKYKDEIETLQKFLSDNQLDLIRADKSKQIIIVTQKWVKSKQLEIVEGKKFRKLPINPKETLYEELKKRVIKLQKLNKITRAEREFILNQDNDRTPKLNVKLKTHKMGEKVRPIVDFKFATLYNLEKFLKQKLKKYQNSKHSIKNTEELLDSLKNVKIEKTSKMASLDVIDMYPSIKWELIEDKLKKLEVESHIIELIEFAYMSNYFEIDEEYYTQNNGISMGSVIGPKLAEIIMIDVDKEINNITGIKYYKRYVDDVLIIYNDAEVKPNMIKHIINNIDKDIQFKIEEENVADNSIRYLDVMITRNENELDFEPFKKPCSINTTIKYTSNIPLYIKQNIFNMEYRKIQNRTSKETNKPKHIIELKKKSRFEEKDPIPLKKAYQLLLKTTAANCDILLIKVK